MTFFEVSANQIAENNEVLNRKWPLLFYQHLFVKQSSFLKVLPFLFKTHGMNNTLVLII